ncbi:MULTISPECIES: sigma-54 dependent transcriptional regulator [unclassified Aliihoeflea]|uniref:sigma-54-dependent transcriptional regulator n=1 Tax=unclassified Aliihoeflea TaxID=2628764 RepID=UPI000464E7F1|nr:MULTISPECIES: sigma-54 dependent transcriptional regulator [unclassified Aliihoeflea]MCO6388900.1 response regulator [Aliihoeflea sp. 40Bstr573]
MQPDRPLIGLVEDDAVMGGSLVQRLDIEGYRTVWWQSGADALAALLARAREFDLVVCDIRLPDMTGEDVFERLAKEPEAPPVMFVTGFAELDQAVRLMRAGAVDFMTKPFATPDFLQRLSNNRRNKVQREPTSYVLGESPAIRRVEDLVRKFAAHDLPVLVTGETGSGKEVAARLLHDLSPRANAPFIAVNCAAIPAELLESELFGHEKGAFTGAVQRHLGYAERAGDGTLFLDEIGDMPPLMQAKLLRLIEAGSFSRVGGEVELPFRARVVAASHRDLSIGGGFREDLYFRIAVLPVSIPPLRSRPEDITWLMDRFLDAAASRSGGPGFRISALAEDMALEHDWRGNVRELRNRCERAAALAVDDWIMPGDLFPEKSSIQGAGDFLPLADAREAAERRQIERALRETSGHISKAATLLDVSRTTLFNKMSRHGIGERERSET